jgi:NADPH-dependent curcumin reductase CurA
MIATENKQIRLVARPVGLPKPSDWEVTTEPLRPPAAGEVVVQVLYLSLDPAMRGWMDDRPSYLPPVRLGDVMRASGVGRVTASESPALHPGDFVTGVLNAQAYATVAAGSLSRIDAERFPLTMYLNVLGMSGLTAYFGLLDVGRPEPGQTVVVSGAGGAVGMTVGQIAKIKGCHVVGIAGGPKKCAFVVEQLGFDAAIDYKAQDVAKGLREHCKSGIDVYFDNVGGETLDACLARLARKARIVLCGGISQYNTTSAVVGPSNYLSLIVNRARMEGMLVLDYAPRFAEGIAAMKGYVEEGKLISREDIVDGLEMFPDALLRLFSGQNFGKLVLKVADP